MNVDSQPTDWRSIAIVYLSGAVAALALLKASPAALDLRAEFALGLSQVAWISSIFTLTTVVLGVFVGRWIARFGARKLAGLGLLVLALAGSASLLAIGPVSLLIGRLVEGIGYVLVVVAAPTLMAGLATPQDSRLVLGIWSTWLPAGGIFIMLAAPALLTIGGWQALWLTSAVAALVVLAFITRVPLPDKSGPAPAVNLRQSLAHSKPWLLALVSAFFTVQLYAVLLFAPTYLVQEVGFTVAQSTLVASVVLVMAAVGGLLGSAAIHRGTSPNLMMGIGLVLVAGLIPCLIIFAHTGTPALGLLFLYGLFIGFVPPSIYAQAPSAAYVPAATGIVLGVTMAGNGLGILIGPPLVAVVIEVTASWLLGAMVAVAACVGGVVCAVMLSRVRSSSAGPAVTTQNNKLQ